MAAEREATSPVPPDNKAFLAWLQTLPDPEQRYRAATSALEDYQEMVSQLSELRATAVADASAGASVSAVARRFGVSRQRAHQLLRQGKGAQPAAPAERGPEKPQKEKKPDDDQ